MHKEPYLLSQNNTGFTFRLEKGAYEDLERKLGKLTPAVPKTELEAGFALGVEHVLKALRTGYVIGT